MDHPQQSMFEQFAIGALADEESAAFLEHASDCDDCAKRLELEAQRELAIREVHAASKGRVASAPAPRRTERWARGRIWRAAGALALAAGVLLFVMSRRSASPTVSTMTVSASPLTAAAAAAPSTQPIPLVVCPDSLEQEKCVEDAHRHGLFVGYPPWANAPRLGGGGSGQGAQGPSGSPLSAQQM